SAFAAMTRAHAGALLVLADTVFSEHRSRLADLVAMSHLPTMMHQDRALVEARGPLSYWGRPPDGGRRRGGGWGPEAGGGPGRRLAGGAADEVRADHQPQDREGTGDHDAAIAAPPGG